MDPAVAIGLWAVLFVGSHLVISSDQVRPRLIGRIREQPYRGVYSFVAFATFVPLVVAFARHKHAGPMLWYLRDVAPVRGSRGFGVAATIAIVMFHPAVFGGSPLG